MQKVSDLGVTLPKGVEASLRPFTDYFEGFDRVQVVKQLFGENVKEVLANLKVEFFSARWGYMSTSDRDGHLLISTHHLDNSDFRTVYLDIVHELCHVKQFFDGRTLYDDRFAYVDSPVEIEAYRTTVKEARRIGMSDKEISEYLRVEWNSEEEHRRLLSHMGIDDGHESPQGPSGRTVP